MPKDELGLLSEASTEHIGMGTDNEGNVAIRVPGGVILMAPDQAREFALRLIECANRVQEGRPGCLRG